MVHNALFLNGDDNDGGGDDDDVDGDEFMYLHEEDFEDLQ
jgi:hypothetical protein